LQLLRAETRACGRAFRQKAGSRPAETKGSEMKERQTSPGAGQKTGGAGVQGEGDYESARVYKKDIDEFIATKKDKIPDMAKDAERALSGREGEELKRAEETGKSKARR
jgi:hypothetical protein